LDLLITYLKRALELNMIDEVHIWNYTCNSEDDKYIKNISNVYRTTSISNGKYIHALLNVIDNHITFHVIAKNDIHVKFLYNQQEYEIILGAFSNTRSIIRINQTEKCIIYQNIITNALQKMKIDIYVEKEHEQLYVKINGKLFMCIDCEPATATATATVSCLCHGAGPGPPSTVNRTRVPVDNGGQDGVVQRVLHKVSFVVRL
jgi:hypothetical protein